MIKCSNRLILENNIIKVGYRRIAQKVWANFNGHENSTIDGNLDGKKHLSSLREKFQKWRHTVSFYVTTLLKLFCRLWKFYSAEKYKYSKK